MVSKPLIDVLRDTLYSYGALMIGQTYAIPTEEHVANIMSYFVLYISSSRLNASPRGEAPLGAFMSTCSPGLVIDDESVTVYANDVEDIEQFVTTFAAQLRDDDVDRR